MPESKKSTFGLSDLFRPQPDEVVNTITHGIGLLLSIAASVTLAWWVFAGGDWWRIIGCVIYASTLVGVYAASTLSHSSSEPRVKRLFRILDQAFIYLLIAGTYTPFALAYLRGTWWWLFLALMWSVALFGFFSKVVFAHRIDGVAIWLYLTLAWLPVVAAAPLLNHVPAIALWWMLFGGICYSLGTIFLLNDHRSIWFHPLWHVLVIAGSAWHFFSILFFVASSN